MRDCPGCSFPDDDAFAFDRQAFGESLAHLNMLASIGRLTRDVDTDGAITFVPM